MRVRKLLCIVFACFMLVNCLGISAGAANVETQRDMKLVIERASGRFSLDVPANKTVGATTSFPLEAGEKVRIRATYSPELVRPMIYQIIVLCILLITMYLYISKRDFLYETVEKNL